MKQLIGLLILMNYISFFAQFETDIIGVNYSNYTKSDYGNYTSATQKMEAFVNYGHDLGEKSELFYHISYLNFNLDTNLNEEILYYDMPTSIPDYTILNLATGMKNQLKNKWNLTNFLTVSFTNDFSKNKLDATNFYRSFSFITKKKSANFSYGFGVYTSKLDTEFSILPIISLKLKNTKRGFNLFFPRSLKLWQVITEESYLELKSKLNSDLLMYSDTNLKTSIFSVITDLSYNYIINKKVKIKASVGLPYNEYTFSTDNYNNKTPQFGGINLNFGISYVVFKDEN